jgi:hypothetical protein
MHVWVQDGSNCSSCSSKRVTQSATITFSNFSKGMSHTSSSSKH